MKLSRLWDDGTKKEPDPLEQKLSHGIWLKFPHKDGVVHHGENFHATRQQKIVVHDREMREENLARMMKKKRRMLGSPTLDVFGIANGFPAPVENYSDSDDDNSPLHSTIPKHSSFKNVKELLKQGNRQNRSQSSAGDYRENEREIDPSRRSYSSLDTHNGKRRGSTGDEKKTKKRGSGLLPSMFSSWGTDAEDEDHQIRGSDPIPSPTKRKAKSRQSIQTNTAQDDSITFAQHVEAEMVKTPESDEEEEIPIIQVENPEIVVDAVADVKNVVEEEQKLAELGRPKFGDYVRKYKDEDRPVTETKEQIQEEDIADILSDNFVPFSEMIQQHAENTVTTTQIPAEKSITPVVIQQNPTLPSYETVVNNVEPVVEEHIEIAVGIVVEAPPTYEQPTLPPSYFGETPASTDETHVPTEKPTTTHSPTHSTYSSNYSSAHSSAHTTPRKKQPFVFNISPAVSRPITPEKDAVWKEWESLINNPFPTVEQPPPIDISDYQASAENPLLDPLRKMISEQSDDNFEEIRDVIDRLFMEALEQNSSSVNVQKYREHVMRDFKRKGLIDDAFIKKVLYLEEKRKNKEYYKEDSMYMRRIKVEQKPMQPVAVKKERSKSVNARPQNDLPPPPPHDSKKVTMWSASRVL
jgi:hypothetical protein